MSEILMHCSSFNYYYSPNIIMSKSGGREKGYGREREG
jgi:hypothetical protein